MAKERLYRRGKIWWCWYYTADRTLIRETTTCSDKDAARAVLRRKEQEAQGSQGRKKPYLALEDVLSDLEKFAESHRAGPTLEVIKEKGYHLRRVLGDTADVHGLTQRDLEDYISDRLTKVPPKKEGVTQPPKLAGRLTVKRELSVLRQALRYAEKRGDFRGEVKDLFPEFAVPYVPRKRVLTPAQFEAVVARLEPHRRLWVQIAVYSGGRRSEVEGLDWSDIQWAAGMVHLRGTKTAKSDRTVPLAGALAKVLKPIKQTAGRIVQSWPNIVRDLKVVCTALDINPVSPNDLRRSYASWLISAGVSSSIVSNMLGHSTTTLVDLTYGKVSREAMKDAVAKLPR